MSPGARRRRIVRRGGIAIDMTAEGTGPPFVLLPSAARDSLDFDDLAAAIAAAGWRVLRPQPRGIEGSRGPLEDLTLHDLAADVAAAIEAEGGRPAVVAGHAFGSWTARAAAVDHPGLVRGVVLIAAAAKAIPPELSAAVTRSGDTSLPEAERLAALRGAFFAPGHDPSAWLSGWHPAVREAQRRAGQATPREEWWAAGTAPILDLQADQDPFRPSGTRDEIARALGDRVTVVVVPGASHALVPEQPAAVAAAIVGWLRRLEGSSPP